MNNRFLRCNYDVPDALFAIDDKLCTNNLFPKNDSLAQQTIRFYKAFRQSYTHALIDNKLWIQ
jgi:hypothetical protein